MGLYDLDFHAWTQAQADAIRRRSTNEIDWDNVLEEIESLGKSQRSELRSRLLTLIVHLLKWEHQPERRGRSWALTIVEQRAKLQSHLEDNPSLRGSADEEASRAYKAARAKAAREMKRSLESLPTAAPYAATELLEEDWVPGGALGDHL